MPGTCRSSSSGVPSEVGNQDAIPRRCGGNDLNDFVADPPTGIRADRRPPSSAALGPPMAPITTGTTTRGAAHQGASPPRLVALSERGSQVLVAGYSLPAHFVESTHKENLYGSSRSTFAAGVFGPAPIPTLKLSLVDCEI